MGDLLWAILPAVFLAVLIGALTHDVRAGFEAAGRAGVAPGDQPGPTA